MTDKEKSPKEILTYDYDKTMTEAWFDFKNEYIPSWIQTHNLTRADIEKIHEELSNSENKDDKSTADALYDYTEIGCNFSEDEMKKIFKEE
jgi:hypothetical protein